MIVVVVAACGSTSTARLSPSATPSPVPTPSPSPTAPSPAPTQAATPSPSATPVATAAEMISVAERTFPRSTEGGQVFYIDCSNGGNTYAQCPFTKRLLTRLQAIHVPPCRCQSFFPQRRVTTEPTPTGGIAHVNFGLARIDLILVRSSGKLVVDDERCGGRGPSSSIYANAGPC
ncbi:MAG: hypothetical protein ABR564_02885 [Candidatus Dormibacteria bacterium]